MWIDATADSYLALVGNSKMKKFLILIALILLPVVALGQTRTGGGGSGNASSIQGITVSSTAPSSGQCLTYNGTLWIPGSCSGGGGTWATLTLGGTNTGTGMVFAPTATGTVPYTLNCPSGITVDCLDVELNGTKEWWIDQNGNMNFSGTQLDLGSATSTTAGLLDVHGGQTTATPGRTRYLNNADGLSVFVGGSNTAGRLMMNATDLTNDVVQSYVLSAPLLNPQTVASYALVAGDFNKFITRTNAGAMTDSISRAGAGTGATSEASFGAGWWTTICVLSTLTGSDTITPTTSTINGASTLVLAPNQCADIISDGTNYQIRQTIATSGGTAFSGLTGGTNTTAAMIVGTGASLVSVPQFNIGATGTSGVLGLIGTTDGVAATFTAPAVAGTRTNPITVSNIMAGPNGSAGQVTWGFTNCSACGFWEIGGQLVFEGGSELHFNINSTENLDLLANNLQPTVDASLALGASTLRFSNVFSTTYSETNLLISNTAPTISSGFGTGPSVTANNGTAAFRINVGTSNTGNGVIALPTAATGWNCYATDITHTSAAVSQTKTTGSTTATATLQNYTDLSATGAWVDSDILAVSCFAF